MEQWLTQLINHLPDGGPYLIAIFLIAFSESLPAAGLIVPGSTLIVGSGFLASHQHGTLVTIVIFSILGAYLGDLLSFELGKKHGPTILRIRWFQRKRHWVKLSEIFFIHHGGKSLFFARFLGPIRGIIPFIAGLSEMPRRTFNTYTPISAVLWGICYPGIGYLGGSSWQKAQSLSARFGLVLVLLLAIIIVHYIVKHKLQNNQPKPDKS